MNINDLRNYLEFEIAREKNLTQLMNRRLAVIPEGSLVEYIINGKHYYYLYAYVTGKKEGMSLDSSNEEHREVIKELMEKKTIVHGLPILKKNIKLMEKCFKELKQYHPTMFKYGELLGSEYYLEGDVCIRDWKKKPESQNPFRRQDLIHGTKKDINVRSKSEMLISDTLYDSGLLFKYETSLKFKNGKIVYPDFEILHPKINELIWWEHLGRADDGVYMQDNLEKLESYGNAGLIPGKNLIITSETASSPLTRGTVLNKMKKYGLV